MRGGERLYANYAVLFENRPTARTTQTIRRSNAFDEHVVAVWKDGQAVGHLPPRNCYNVLVLYSQKKQQDSVQDNGPSSPLGDPWERIGCSVHLHY